ncbi:hypothetical protein Hanom_Chr03g00212861 [Helianthus anomalus]
MARLLLYITVNYLPKTRHPFSRLCAAQRCKTFSSTRHDFAKNISQLSVQYV